MGLGRGKPFQRKCGAQEATANCTIGLPCVVDLMAFDEALMMPWQEVTVSELLIVPGSGCLGPPAGLWVDRSTPQAHPRFAINCEISCVTNAFASGKLQCDYGHFRHITTLPLEIVFSVPRCYRSCSFQCDGKQTHVMHGEFYQLCRRLKRVPRHTHRLFVSIEMSAGMREASRAT